MAKTKLTLPGATKSKVTLPTLPDLPPPPAPDDKALEAVISKGGTVPSEVIKPEKGTGPVGMQKEQSSPAIGDDPLKAFTIKIYQSELNRIEAQQALMRKRDRLSKADYILLAIQEKLARDEKKQARKKS